MAEKVKAVYNWPERFFFPLVLGFCLGVLFGRFPFLTSMAWPLAGLIFWLGLLGFAGGALHPPTRRHFWLAAAFFLAVALGLV